MARGSAERTIVDRLLAESPVAGTTPRTYSNVDRQLHSMVMSRIACLEHWSDQAERDLRLYPRSAFTVLKTLADSAAGFRRLLAERSPAVAERGRQPLPRAPKLPLTHLDPALDRATLRSAAERSGEQLPELRRLAAVADWVGLYDAVGLFVVDARSLAVAAREVRFYL